MIKTHQICAAEEASRKILEAESLLGEANNILCLAKLHDQENDVYCAQVVVRKLAFELTKEARATFAAARRGEI